MRKARSPTRSTSAPKGAAYEFISDVWGPANATRTIVDASGARTTFTFDGQSHTIIEAPGMNRVTVTWCPSQMTATAAALSQFAAHVLLRAMRQGPARDGLVRAFVAHPESQRHLAIAAAALLIDPAKRRRWLEDVTQQANVQLLDDLRRRKAIFKSDDPGRFARWFRGVSLHLSLDALNGVRRCASSTAGAVPSDVVDPNAVEPLELAALRELARRANEELERIPDAILREVMRDLRDGKTTRESASRLGISKSAIDRMRTRGCRLVARRLAK